MAASAVVQVEWRTVLAELWARDIVAAYRTKKDIVRFKIGEGGFINVPPKQPITPDETFTDLESEGVTLPNGGIVEFNNGSPTVTGAGTNFSADVSPGDWFKPGPEPEISGDPYSAGEPGTEEDIWGQVLSVVLATQITLTAKYAGTTHLFAEARDGRTASEPLFTFRKTLGAGEVLFNSANPAITEVTTNVGSLEANADQLGNPPEFFELALFDENGVMVCYCTFDEVTKISGVQLVTIIDLVY